MDNHNVQEATALLTEHLQYTPLSLIDDIIDSVNNLVYQGVGSLETGLLATPSERLGFKLAAKTQDDSSDVDFPEARQEIEEGLHKLETLLNSTVDKNFDKFEIYVLRNILSVPQDLVKWIRLSHYEDMQYPVPSNAPSSESVQMLRQKLNASRNVNKALRREYRRNEAILNQLREMTGPVTTDSRLPNLSFLSESAATRSLQNPSQEPLTTATTFTLSQLPALRAVLRELRSDLATSKSNPLRADTAKDERREERREYIEQRTKAHIQRSGQTAGDDHDVGSSRVDQAEVESLEKVAALFNPT